MRMGLSGINEVLTRPGLIQEEIGERSIGVVKVKFFDILSGGYRYMDDELHVEEVNV